MRPTRTGKPFATISFNTLAYLTVKLNELIQVGKVTFWACIEHMPEDDEGGRKEHIHLYIEPAKMIQTDEVREFLREYDPATPDRPRGCLPCSGSKFDPWYMYALHDKRYLASKSQARRYHYSHDQIVTSDPDYLTFKARQIDMLALSPYADMEDAQRQGVTWPEYFARGTVPLPQVVLFERAWNLLQDSRTQRAEREGHPMDVDPTWCGGTHSEWNELYESATVDPDTGEVIEHPELEEFTPDDDEVLPWY